MDEEYRFSAPGRVEIGGNHTDHQHGRVLAAAINLESKAIVRRNCEGKIRVISEGYEPVEIDVWDLGVHEEEKNTTAALIRGVASAFTECGCKLGGLDAKVSSTVLPGSGLSSSAAFEVLIGRILNGLFFEDKLTPVQIAQIGQYAENVYFGKPCGLMDQTASSVGGLVYIDFRDPAHPVVENVEYDFDGCGYTQTFFKIMLPIARPGILTAAMLAFMNYWNEYYWASMVLTTKELKTVPAILAQFQNAFSTNYNGMFSAIVVILLPPVILFCCFSKYFIEALSGGAVKG